MRIQSTMRGSRRCIAHTAPRRRLSAGMMLLPATCAWCTQSMLIPPVVDVVGDRTTEPFLVPLFHFRNKHRTTGIQDTPSSLHPSFDLLLPSAGTSGRSIGTIRRFHSDCSFERGSIVMRRWNWLIRQSTRRSLAGAFFETTDVTVTL
jgi:hypothetical protein